MIELSWAVRSGKLDDIKRIFNNTALEVDTTNEFGETALHIAAYCNHYEVVAWLLSKRGDQNERDSFVTRRNWVDYTALHYAAQSGELRVVDFLIKEATDKNKYVTAINRRCETALHLAAAHGNLQIVERLIQEATDKNKYVTTIDQLSATALHEAAAVGDLEIVKRLIQEAANKNYYLNMADSDGNTALHKFANGTADSAAIGVFLIENNADPRIKNLDRLTAWDIVRKKKNWDVISGFIFQELDWGPRLRILTSGEFVLKKGIGFGDGVEYCVIHGNNMARVYKQLYAIARSLAGPVIGLEGREMEQAANDHVPAEHIGMLPSNFETRPLEIFGSMLHHIHQDFLENHEAPQHRRAREPSCSIQTLDNAIDITGMSREFISLVMPFVYVADWATIGKRTEKYAEETQNFKYCIGNSHELLEVHMLLTLDEYCSPALSQNVLDFRNKDQVLGRYERPLEKKEDNTTMPPENHEEDNLTLLSGLWLLVELCVWKLGHLFDPETWQRLWHKQPTNTAERRDRLPKHAVFIGQAWVWKICGRVIIAIPHEVYKEIRAATFWQQKQDTRVVLALLLNRLIEHLDDPAHPLLKTYENALSIISEEKKKFFHWISDLREELSMIKSVIAEQEEVWKEFMNSEWPNQEPKELWKSQTKFHKYRRRIAKLEEDAERVERNIATKLDLKQKHATMKEAHSTAIMSASVFGFTVITVIFTPLSFVVALFALPIDEFDKGKAGNDKDGVYLTQYIGKWVAVTESVSVFVTLVAMWAALRFGMGLHVWGKRGLREWVRRQANTMRTSERYSRHRSGDAIEEKGELSKDRTARHGGRRIIGGLMKGLKRSNRNRSDEDGPSDPEPGGNVEPASV
ncbi:hypothetical protein GQX73_g10198 [Xylaria multiplex]|uniref:Uncharacterized protein n=1 Tax=Xylaria multiplex TaxID=323545 RepID=A0A7C8MLY2_9PEZI|nr:hypothetical protein GQX73_g10198 [Xylaria multiplex]